MPKPSAIGSDVAARMRPASASAPSATVSRVPVTPSREMPYKNPRPSFAASFTRASVVVGLSRKIMSMSRAAIASRKLPGLFDRQIEHEHAIDTGRARAIAEYVDAHPEYRIGVGEQHNRRLHRRPDARDEIEHARGRGACRQRPLRRALNHRAVGERLGKRNPHLEHVGAGAIERTQNIGRTRHIRIARRDIRHEPGAFFGANALERGGQF